MIDVLVTGAKGQLGSCIQEIGPDYPELNFFYTDKEQLDITDFDEISSFFNRHSFDYCINTAAYTQVEEAEDQPELAYLVNATAAGNLARICQDKNCVLIHISTDYVFDGAKSTPYVETDATAPLSVYGASKLAGEELVITECLGHFVFRTSWLYSLYGHNFLKTISRLLAQGKQLKITTEQIGTPTNGHELAVKLLDLVRSGSDAYGTYHLSNSGAGTWFDFAKEIAQNSPELDPKNVEPTDHYPTKAKRPAYSVLSCGKAEEQLGLKMGHWAHSLAHLLNSAKK